MQVFGLKTIEVDDGGVHMTADSFSVIGSIRLEADPAPVFHSRQDMRDWEGLGSTRNFEPAELAEFERLKRVDALARAARYREMAEGCSRLCAPAESRARMRRLRALKLLRLAVRLGQSRLLSSTPLARLAMRLVARLEAGRS